MKTKILMATESTEEHGKIKSIEPLAKLAREEDLLAETARKRRVPILPGVKIGLLTKPKRTGK